MTPDSFSRVVASGVQLRILDSIDSTNRFLIDNPGPDNVWSVVVTDHQISGRGRQGRKWSTLPGRGLAVSCQLPASVVPQPIDHGWLGWLSLIVGTSLADAVSTLTGVDAWVKWPNDVYISGKKVAGILGEIGPESRVVVGIGINVFHSSDDLPTPDSTSLSIHATLPSDILDQLVSTLLSSLTRNMPQVRDSIPSDIREWVEARLGTLRRPVRITLPGGGALVGVATGLADDGALIVQEKGSRDTVSVHVGDIEHLRHE